EARIQETGGLVKVGELAEVAADPLQMRQLLQNLIGNGLKYHRAGEPPVVEVLGRVLEKGNGNRNANEDEDGGLPPGTPAARVFQLVVSDNGIGLEEKDSERIFAPFVRLHGRGEYEGTGMGLAVCRKIAERHGGTITARGSPGQGSRFIVTLPLGARGEGPRGRTGEADEPQEAARLEEVRS